MLTTGITKPMLKLRYATIDDLPAINTIYNHFIVNTAITFDVDTWSLEKRLEWYNDNHLTADSVFLVAQKGAEIVGFAYNSPYNPKAAYRRSTEVTIYKDPNCQIKGIGRVLYKRLLQELKLNNFKRAYALITMPNDASHKLHITQGFEQVGLLTEVGEKLGKTHDVAIFEKSL